MSPKKNISEGHIKKGGINASYQIQSRPPDPPPMKPIPANPKNLEPGLQAAIDLLEREARNESNAARHRQDNNRGTGFRHRENAAAYRKAVYLLEEQRARILG